MIQQPYNNGLVERTIVEKVILVVPQSLQGQTESSLEIMSAESISHPVLRPFVTYHDRRICDVLW